MNHEVLEALLMIGAGNTTQASGHQMIWVHRDQGAMLPIPKTIYGRPYVLSEKLPAKGDQGDIGFYDLSYYLIGDRQKLTIDTSAHVGFISNSIYWRFTLRVDGQPWLQSDLTPKNGTQHLSPFVCLSATS
jgi:HK97 family phage major capsid protein